MVEIEQTAESWTARAAGIELSFRYLGDRWGHVLQCLDRDERQVLLTSCEGGPDDSQPPSPAWQELLVERPNETCCEFQLFGRVGAGIYSAAVRFEGDAGIVTFDACVSRRKPDASVCTRCTYDIEPAGAAPRIAAEHGPLVTLDWPTVRLTLEPLTLDGQPISSCREIGDGKLRRLAIGHFEAGTETPSRASGTLRWGYRLQLHPRTASPPTVK